MNSSGDSNDRDPTGDADTAKLPATGTTRRSEAPDESRHSDIRPTLREGSHPALRPSSPSSLTVLDAVLGLARGVRVDMSDEEIIRRYAHVIQELFPGRRILVRAIQGDDRSFDVLFASHPVLEQRREGVELTLEALSRHDVESSLIPTSVSVTERYQSVFSEGALGFDFPILDGSGLSGVLCIEYPPEVAEEPEDDRSLIVQLGLQLGAALRNSRLLRESRYLRDYLSKLIDHANAPILVFGRGRELRVVNRAFLALTEMSRGELLGRDLLDLIPADDKARIVPAFVRALEGRSSSAVEVRLPRASGDSVRVSMNIAAVKSGDGTVEAVIAIGRDLTEVRRLEEQVIQAEKLATLGQLAAGVVHELNNPLTSISVYTEYLLKKAEQASDSEPGDVEKLRRVLGSADRILRFTRDLVTYARPSTEEPETVRVGEVLDQALVFCEHIIRESRVSVRTSFAPDLPTIYAVRGQLHQVFINLVTNACHAVDGDAGELEVAARHDATSDVVVVRVKDNGCGIPPDHVEHVFEPFFSTKGEGKGTGLGLSIVRNIVQQHGGRIRVASEAGRGTTFEVSLPVPPRPLAADPSQ